MRHLLEISKLKLNEIENLLDTAFKFKSDKKFPTYPDISLVNLFYEPSTRTKLSFELAAKKLSLLVSTLDVSTSSVVKGETILDTLETLGAMGVNLVVLRHKEDYLPTKLAQEINNISLINAGDGMHAHPTQALLDVMTIIDNKKDLNNLKVTIIGDIKHSRVANSLQLVFALLKVKSLVLVAPEFCKPDYIHYGTYTTSLTEGLKDADVVITLRVQKERMPLKQNFDMDDYINNYQITPKTLELAKKDVILMHPGPVNRGIEIVSSLVKDKQSKILSQVENGVYMRMAIINELAKAYV